MDDTRITKLTAADAVAPPVPDRNNKEPAVVLSHVGCKLQDSVILNDVELTVPCGNTVAIIGPSGAGKTTLLRCVNFLIPYSTGSIRVSRELIGYRDAGGRRIRRREREIQRQRARIGFVFQRLNLFPHRNALDNLLEGPMRVLNVPREEATDRAVRALRRVGLEEKAGRYPVELSGGEQQRVAIARAICMEPAVMLFDEVTSALDPELVSEVLAVMRQLAEEGMTMVVVTHELRFAQRGADRTVFMEQGRVVADVPTDSFFADPPSERIRMYLAEITR